MVSPIPPKPPAPPKPPGKRPPGGPRVSDTRGPNYPKNPARPGETKAQYSERVRATKPTGTTSAGPVRGPRDSGTGAPKPRVGGGVKGGMAPIDSGRGKIPAPPGRGAGTGGGSSSGGGRRDMGPVRGAPKGPAPMPPKPTKAPGGMGGRGRSSTPGGSRGTDGGKPARVMGGPSNKMGPMGGSRPKPLKGKM
jgi:hypothetical protein